VLLVCLIEEEKRRRCLGHLWETSVEAKEDLLVLMLACCGSLVVARKETAKIQLLH
jgi:hypothetical protein